MQQSQDKKISPEDIWKKIQPYKPQHKRRELCELLTLMRLNDIRSVLEIGFGTGGTAAAFLELGCKVLSIDVRKDPIIAELVANYTSKNFRFYQANTQVGKAWEFVATSIKNGHLWEFDMVYIDGDHTEAGARSDYENFGKWFAKKMIVFHDIVASELHETQDCFVSKVWKDVRKDFRSSIEITFPDENGDPREWGGLGVIYL